MVEIDIRGEDYMGFADIKVDNFFEEAPDTPKVQVTEEPVMIEVPNAFNPNAKIVHSS